MRLYNRNGILWVDTVVKGNRTRKSTKLKYSQNNIRLFKSHIKNDKFFEEYNVNVDTPRVTELCEEVLREKECTLKSTSYVAYLSLYMNRIVPYFDKKLVTEIKPKHIEEWYKSFTDRSTLTTSEAILKIAFEKAILREYINQTPLIVSKPIFTSTYEITPFDYSEIELLLQNSEKWLNNFIGISFFTGVRTGELIGLKWEDVNLKDFTISINRTITNGFIQTPKTKTSERVIDILPQCEEFLINQRKITGLSEFVFLTRKNTHFNGAASLNRIWEKLLKKCDLQKRGIYQLRHSFVSNMLSNGEDLLWVSSMLGHKNATITLEKYSKYIRKKRERKTTFFDSYGTNMAQS